MIGVRVLARCETQPFRTGDSKDDRIPMGFEKDSQCAAQRRVILDHEQRAHDRVASLRSVHRGNGPTSRANHALRTYRYPTAQSARNEQFPPSKSRPLGCGPIPLRRRRPTYNKHGAALAPTVRRTRSIRKCSAFCRRLAAPRACRSRGKFQYASNVAQLVKNGYLEADPSTDAYKITTTKQGTVTAAPDCTALV